MGCNIRIVPMTQELFDSIQLERLKVGEELESAALDTFLKYPEFALNYSSRLESALITSNTISLTMQKKILSNYMKKCGILYMRNFNMI